MEKWKRSIFFWILAALFLITAYVVVLSARGYRFDAKRGVFVYSGTITFKSNPQSVDVKLNNKATQSKKLNRINNSYNVSGLIPNDYNIQISAQGFQPWSKKTQVHSGMASEFWNVLLVKKNYEKTNYGTLGMDKFFISPKNQSIVYTTKTDADDLTVKIFNINNAKTEKEFNFAGWQFIDESRKENIEWSPEEAFISVPVEKPVAPKTEKNITFSLKNQTLESKINYDYFIVDLENNKTIDLKQLTNMDNIRDVRWDPKEKGFLFFLSNDVLFRVDMNNIQNINQITENISSYDISGPQVYYSKNGSGLLFKNNLDGKSKPVQITNSFLDISNPVIVSMVVYDDSRIALILGNGDLYIFNNGDHDNYFRKIGSTIQGVHFSNDGKKLLFWSNNEISVYFLRDQISQPFRNEDEIETITRYSEPIKNIQWFSDYEHIIFSTNQWIKIIEIDLRDHANCMDLTNTEIQNPFVIYNDPLKKLFFTDSKDGQLSLYSINFPENNSIFQAVGLGG